MASIFPDEYRELIELLTRARKEAGMTQEQLASALRQRQTFVSKYELGERRLDIAEFAGICQVIGVDPGQLLKTSKA